MDDTKNTDFNSIWIRDFLQEKRAERRWKNIRFIFWFILVVYIILGIFSFFGGTSTSNNIAKGGGNKYTALVRLDGMIAPNGDFSAAAVLPTLHQAFADKQAQGVILVIDSPGGTPVQASIIHDAIIQYKTSYHKKVVVVGEDMLTSGAYFVAVAADKIYVNPNSITGSIGVIMKGFGFVDTLKKLGVERRVYTSGDSKDRLDPFLPQNPNDIAKIKEVEAEIHQNFAQAVLEGRKGKLKGDPKTLFNGDFWSGQTAKTLGLVDELGNLMNAMNQEFKTTKYKEYGNNSSGLFKLLENSFSSSLDNLILRFG